MKILFSSACAFALCVSFAVAAESALDTFGVQKFYPTKAGTVEWNSAHWAGGAAYTLSDWSEDSHDPLNWTEDHSSDEPSGAFRIDGKGVMQMVATEARFHINSQKSYADKKQFFLNTEFTAYFKSVQKGEDYSGMVMGVRTQANAHGSDGDLCNATTYYARFRYDGKWDFEKELKHPGSYYTSGSTASDVGVQPRLWDNSRMLPTDRWIGMKYIAYNLNSTTVHLEVWIDSTTNGEATGGGKWEKVGEANDDGTLWPGASYGAATIDGCSYSDSKTAITEGLGTALMRVDSDTPYYKKVSLREIDPSGGCSLSTCGSIGIRPVRSYKGIFPVKKVYFDLNGRRANPKK